MPYTIKVGFHDFLNSKPLLHPFRHGLMETPFELVTDIPSALADRFADGELDMALIPSIEYGRIPGCVIAPVVCVASLGAVETVLLFSEMGIEDVQSVAVDPKSRSSSAMLQILFHEKFNKTVTLTTGDEDPALALRSADAGLIIGDRAFGIDRDKYVVHDLGELWYRHCGRPFVHAVLCAWPGKKLGAAIRAIEQARDIGIQSRELVARSEAKTPEETEKFIEYLNTRIFYTLGEQETEGLKYFLTAGKSLGICQRDDIVFYSSD